MAKKKVQQYKPADDATIEAVAKEMVSSWGGVAPGEQIEELDNNRLSISSGSTKLDWALVKPFVEGTINEIHGKNGCGKTTLALEIAANATLMGKPVYFFDLERKLVNSQISMIPRLNRKLFTRIRPENGEDAVNKVHYVVSNVPGCVVIFDSLTQMLPEVEDAEKAEKQTMGTVARLAAKMVRKIVGPVERNRCMVLFISHITTNMEAYSYEEKTKGGKAVPDIASQRIRLKANKGDLIKDKNNGNAIVGQMTKCYVVKNNQGLSYKEVEIPIIYGKGISRALDLLQIARDLAVIDYTSSGGWYTYEFGDTTKKLHEAELLDIIRTNKEYREHVIAKVQEML